LPLTYTVNAGPTGKEVSIKTAITSTSYLVTTLTPGTTCFTVNATDSAGGVSGPSSEACKATGTGTAQAVASVTITPVPTAPGSVTVQ
jgi:hypothetical protein